MMDFLSDSQSVFENILYQLMYRLTLRFHKEIFLSFLKISKNEANIYSVKTGR